MPGELTARRSLFLTPSFCLLARISAGKSRTSAPIAPPPAVPASRRDSRSAGRHSWMMNGRVIGNGVLFGIPVPLCIFLLCGVGLSLILSRPVFGFSLYMLGTNPEATRYAGINNARTLLGVYLLSSFLASIAGVIMMARFNSAKADYGQSYLLVTILAAVLGGTSASGGYGKVIGVVFAIIMLQMLASGLNLLGVDPFFAIAMWGAILLLVMTLNHFFRRRV